MIKNKNFIKIAILLFLAVSIFLALFIGLGILVGADMSGINIFSFYIMSVLFLYIPLFLVLCFSMGSFKIGKKVVELEAGNIDFNKDKNYFRDILKQYGVLELAYIMKISKFNEYDITAAILELERKKVIKLKDNKIESVDSSKISNKLEKQLVRNRIHGKIKISDLSIITDYAKDEAVKSGLIEKETNIGKDILKMFLKTVSFCALSFLALYIVSVLAYNNFEGFFINILSIIVLLLSLASTYGIVYFISYVIHKFDSYKLTNKGKELKDKIVGLKLYVKDFGNFKDEEKESIKLWDEYLIYSVMFELNDKVAKEMRESLIIEDKLPISKKDLFIILFVIVVFAFILFI